MDAMTVIAFEPHRTAREEQGRVERAHIEAGKFFDDATVRQRAAFLAVTNSARDMHGWGSDAHKAAIDLAKRQWEEDTAEASKLLDISVQELLATGELTEETGDAWTELCQREAVSLAMAAE